MNVIQWHHYVQTHVANKWLTVIRVWRFRVRISDDRTLPTLRLYVSRRIRISRDKRQCLSVCPCLPVSALPPLKGFP